MAAKSRATKRTTLPKRTKAPSLSTAIAGQAADSSPTPIDALPDEHKPERPGPPVAGIGASAGGLDAFKKFFAAMPADSGIAFVLIPHLDPKHESLMVELLGRHTKHAGRRGRPKAWRSRPTAFTSFRPTST